MATHADYSLGKLEDGTITIQLNPPVAIGGWTIRYQESRRFGGLSGFNQKYLAPNFNGVSGITMVSSGNGTIQVAINSVDSSGLDFGAYAFMVERLDAGNRTILADGYRMVSPNTTP